MNFSVIIPAYDSWNYLHKTLDSVISNDPETSLEIVVVDSSPVEVPRTYRERYPFVHFLHADRRLYAGAARNFGARNAKHEFLCFLDSDCCWSSKWLVEAKSLLREFPDGFAFNGQVFYELPENSPAFCLHLMEFHEFLGKKRWNPRFIHSGNLLIPKHNYQLIGGFREDIPMCTDFTFAARLNQAVLKKVIFEPKLSVTHLAHLTEPLQLIQKVERMGYWRGWVENEIPEKLRLSTKSWFRVGGRHLLGLAFFLTIIVRSFLRRSEYLSFYLKCMPGIIRFCFEWANGFKKGLSEKKLTT